MTTAPQHAFLAPSSASTWGPGGCPAHPRMAAAFPEDGDTLKAREGTAAHWYLAETMAGTAIAVGSLAPNGHPVTDEMVDGAADMLADTRVLMNRPSVHFAIEQRVDMPQIHPTLNWGRCDFGAVDYADRVLYAWDYKFGHGYVDVFENWQLVDYTVGLANHFNVTVEPGWTIDARIYQPRSFHAEGPVKRWTVGGARFFDLVSDLREAAAFASQPDAPMATGSYCDHCSANIHCPAFQRVGGVSIDISMRGVPHELTPANAGLLLGTVRTARERLEDLETGLEAQILASIRSGKLVPGWEAAQGYGRERWTQAVADVVAMGDMLGKDLRKPAEAITPAQARKKGIDEAVISAYSEKPLGEVKLKPVEGRDIRKAFSR